MAVMVVQVQNKEYFKLSIREFSRLMVEKTLHKPDKTFEIRLMGEDKVKTTSTEEWQEKQAKTIAHSIVKDIFFQDPESAEDVYYKGYLVESVIDTPVPHMFHSQASFLQDEFCYPLWIYYLWCQAKDYPFPIEGEPARFTAQEFLALIFSQEWQNELLKHYPLSAIKGLISNISLKLNDSILSAGDEHTLIGQPQDPVPTLLGALSKSEARFRLITYIQWWKNEPAFKALPVPPCFDGENPCILGGKTHWEVVKEVDNQSNGSVSWPLEGGVSSRISRSELTDEDRLAVVEEFLEERNIPPEVAIGLITPDSPFYARNLVAGIRGLQRGMDEAVTITGDKRDDCIRERMNLSHAFWDGAHRNPRKGERQSIAVKYIAEELERVEKTKPTKNNLTSIAETFTKKSK